MDSAKIDQWLRRCADSLSFPLKRTRWKMRYEDVSLGVAVYKSRWAEIFYFEFDIYNEELPRDLRFASPSTPILTRRLRDTTVKRPDGSHPDFAISTQDASLLAYVKQQIVCQGRELFDTVHSMRTLLSVLRRDTLLPGYERWNDSSFDHLAAIVESFLSAKPSGD